MTRVLPITAGHGLEEAVAILQAAGVVAFPTDTVYGVGALATGRGADALFKAKGRPRSKPLPLLASGYEALDVYAPGASELARGLARDLWPGPLTLVLPGRPDVATALGSTDGTLGIRVPDYPPLLGLMERCGGALAATSANLSGGQDPLTAGEVVQQLEDRVPLVLDGGRTAGGTPSTVLDLASSPPRLLRRGPLGREVERRLGDTLAPAEP